MREVSIAELILDFDLYPRTQIDSSHVRYMRIAHEGGTILPQPIIDKKSKRVIDGFHRISMYKRIDKSMKIEVIEKNYASDAEMFADAMRLNAHHGRNLSPFDRAHCIIRAESLGMTVEQIAGDLSMSVEAIGEMKLEKMGTMRSDGLRVTIPIKRTIQHMHGRQLTKRQFEANDRLGGMNQMFYVNQLIELIESDLLDKENEDLMARLQVLEDLLKAVIKEYAVV